MNWFAQHWETTITFGGLAIGQLASYLKLRYDVAFLQRQSDKTEKAVDDHVSSPVLHRTPDFEKSLGEIRAEMVRQNAKLDRLIELQVGSRSR